ncbi:MAG TPA: ABC transporter permease [Actinomycetota bacterium]|nr:ABC transporter permease [Actinomycetota bacterium]
MMEEAVVSAAAAPPKAASGWRGVWAFVRASWLNALAVAIVTIVVLMALVGPLLLGNKANAADFSAILQGPSASHWLGTDNVGRDLLARIVAGARISLASAALIVLLAAPFGCALGILAGMVGGWVDEVLMRFTDLFFAFPAFVLAAAIAATLGPSLEHTILAVAIVYWPWYARLARSQVLTLREREFVLAARVSGSSTGGIVVRHMVRNVLPIVAIQMSADAGNAILSISALSFLGLGAQPPTPEWGTMMAGAQDYLQTAWWFLTFPGLTLTFTVLGFNLLGDGLRDWIDPRLRGVLRGGRV